jgi:hypothetical protein
MNGIPIRAIARLTFSADIPIQARREIQKVRSKPKTPR